MKFRNYLAETLASAGARVDSIYQLRHDLAEEIALGYIYRLTAPEKQALFNVAVSDLCILAVWNWNPAGPNPVALGEVFRDACVKQALKEIELGYFNEGDL
jgi:hypothetical protein